MMAAQPKKLERNAKIKLSVKRGGGRPEPASCKHSEYIYVTDSLSERVGGGDTKKNSALLSFWPTEFSQIQSIHLSIQFWKLLCSSDKEYYLDRVLVFFPVPFMR